MTGELLRWLRGVEYRRRAGLLLRTTSRAAVALAIGASVEIAFDRWASIPPGPRVFCWGVLVVLVFGMIGRNGSGALRRIRLIETATVVERYRPGLEERLVTVVSGDTIAPPVLWSLTHAVNEVLRDRPIKHAWPVRQTMWTLASAAVLWAGLIAGVTALNWTRAARRVIEPWAALSPMSAPTLQLVVTPTAVPGPSANVVVRVIVHGGRGDEGIVTLHVIDRGVDLSIAMTPAGPRQFERNLSGLLQSVDLYATLAEARSRTVRLTVRQ